MICQAPVIDLDSRILLAGDNGLPKSVLQIKCRFLLRPTTFLRLGFHRRGEHLQQIITQIMVIKQHDNSVVCAAPAGADDGGVGHGRLGVPDAGCAGRAAHPAGPRRGHQALRQVPQAHQDTRQELLERRSRHPER